MANVVKFVVVEPPIQNDATHGNAPYTVYPSMHVPALSFLYICSDTCSISIYDDPVVAGCPHPDDHKKHICRVEGEEAEVDTWIGQHASVTEVSSAAADTLGKALAPERPGEDLDGNPITVPEFDINDWL